MKKLLMMIVLLAGCAVQALAQSGSIKGVVLDDKDEPVFGATVKVFEGGLVKGNATTDEDGNYVVKPLVPGRYDVTVAYIGYGFILFGLRVIIVKVVDHLFNTHSISGRHLPCVDETAHIAVRCTVYIYRYG